MADFLDHIYSFVDFTGLFIFIMSLLYIIKVVYDIIKVMTLKEGKVELGKNGLLYLGCSIAYALTYIII